LLQTLVMLVLGRQLNKKPDLEVDFMT